MFETVRSKRVAGFTKAPAAKEQELFAFGSGSASGPGVAPEVREKAAGKVLCIRLACISLVTYFRTDSQVQRVAEEP